MNKFLVVDDFIGMRNMLKLILKNAGYEVIGEAEDGVEAIEKFKKLSPDFVTLDITMPKKNGIETLKELMKINNDVKVIIVSAISEKNLVLEAIELGAKHYILKPLKPEKVMSVIEEVISFS